MLCGPYRLNGECVNVLFKDAASAQKAMNEISEPIPVVDGTILWLHRHEWLAIFSYCVRVMTLQVFRESTHSGGTV